MCKCYKQIIYQRRQKIQNMHIKRAHGGGDENQNHDDRQLGIY